MLLKMPTSPPRAPQAGTSWIATGQIVYTDFGAVKGARPGDYLLIRRGYARAELNKIDQASEQLPKGFDPNAVNQAKLSVNANDRIPSHVLGEMVVLNVTSESSTGLIVRSFAEMELGDLVESEVPQAYSGEETVTTGEKVPPCNVFTRVRELVWDFRDCRKVTDAKQ